MLSFDVTFFIANFLSIPDPIDSNFAIFLWKSKRFEAIAKKWLLFDKIYNINFNLLIFLCIGNLEVKPLVMSPCVDVVLQNEIISLDSISFISIFVDV